MMKMPKQVYAAELKELAFKLLKEGQSIGAVSRELELIEQTLHNWVKAADAGTLTGAGSKSDT